MSDNSRKVERQIELDATPDVVWRALTDADELMRWFPLAARVTPGVAGSIWYSWRGTWESDNRIVIWEPGRRLKMISDQPAPMDVDGQTYRPAPGGPVELSIDFQLQARGGGTVLRVVHSGFGRGSEWDDEVDGVGRGWTTELRGLQHYLTRHLGRDRHVAWLMETVDVAPAEAWARLVGAEAFGAGGVLLPRDGRYVAVPPFGAPIEGAMLLWAPPQDLVGTVDRLADALFRLQVERGGAERSSVGVFLSTWGVPPDVTRAFESESRALIARLFGRGQALGAVAARYRYR